ncbi:MAG TPA: DUF420 domain-containing protein [Tepidisphaeraceae bacterium]
MQGKEFFAAFNSGLNGLSTVLLIVGYILIRNRKYVAHGVTMSITLLCSAVFLASYLYSKFTYGEVSTGMPSGWFRTFYFVVLIPHVILAIVMLPMIGLTVWRAYTRQWDRHRRIAKPTWGIWLYVSVTGVLIYFILYQWYPALYPDAFKASPLFNRG